MSRVAIDGGYNVGWIASGEWLEYTVDVKKSGIYQVEARVATSNSNKRFHVEIDGKNVSGSILVPNTGAWQTWQTAISAEFELDEGVQVIRVKFDSGDFNLNYLKFTCLYPTSSSDLKEKGSIRLYPNPVERNLTFEMDEEQAYISVINNLGQIIMSQQVVSNGRWGTFSVEGLPKGVYQMVIGQEKKMPEIVRFIKK